MHGKKCPTKRASGTVAPAPLKGPFSENASTTPPHELYDFPNATLSQSVITEIIEVDILVE